MSKSQSYTEIMEELIALTRFAVDALETYCIGDMMTWMDEHNLKYAPMLTYTSDETDNQIIKNMFKLSIANKVDELHTQAARKFRIEIF